MFHVFLLCDTSGNQRSDRTRDLVSWLEFRDIYQNFLRTLRPLQDPSFVGINSTKHFASLHSQNVSLINFTNFINFINLMNFLCHFPQLSRSRLRYCIASARCSARISGCLSISAIVLETFKMRSNARADRPSFSIAFFSMRFEASSSWQIFRKIFTDICALQ